eukprot:5360924-Pyramimonas_sp.AAC.1
MGGKRTRASSPFRPWCEGDSGPGADMHSDRRQNEAGGAFVEELMGAYLRGKPVNARLSLLVLLGG